MKRFRPVKIVAASQDTDILGNYSKQLFDQAISNKNQQQLQRNFLMSMRYDQKKQDSIKRKLANKFFIDSKNVSLNMYAKTMTLDPEDLKRKNEISQQLKQSFHITKTHSRSMTPSFTSKNQSFDRENIDQKAFLGICKSETKRKRSDQSSFNTKISKIIDQSTTPKKDNTKKRQRLLSSTERRRQLDKNYKNQLKIILNQIIEADAQNLLKKRKLGKDNTPVKDDEIFENIPNKQKYTMTFTKYMRAKTLKNISKEVCRSQTKQQNNYIQKFQKYVLKEFTFSEQAKLKLSKEFNKISQDLRQNLSHSISIQL